MIQNLKQTKEFLKKEIRINLKIMSHSVKNIGIFESSVPKYQFTRHSIIRLFSVNDWVKTVNGRQNE